MNDESGQSSPSGVEHVNKRVVKQVVDSTKDISLEDAREMAGDEVWLGDMMLIPLIERD